MTDTTAPSLTPQFDELFKPWNRGDAPGFVVGVSHKGQLLYRCGFGLASIEHAAANTPQTRMRIGSTSKHFTCLAILLLEEQGKLDIDQPVADYLPELAGKASGAPTLRQLMHHTGGIRDPLFAVILHNHGYWGHTPAGGNLQLLQRHDGRNFAPGTDMMYCNAGYTLLSLVVGRVSGRSFADFLYEHIFAPLGMLDTRLLASDMEIVPNMATLHLPQPGGGWRRGIYPTDDLLGSGGIISTVDDMLTWTAHLRSPQKRVGSAASWQKMLQPFRLANGTEGSYCLGLTRQSFRGLDTIHHAGATLGSQCQMLTAPSEDLDIVVMSNRMDGHAPLLAQKIMELVVAARLPPPRPPPAADDHPGLLGRWYSSTARTLIDISRIKALPDAPEGMMLSAHGSPTGLLTECDGRLGINNAPTSPIDLLPPAAGETPASLDFRLAGETQRFERLPQQAPAAADLAAAFCGRYRSIDYGPEIEILLQNGKLYLDFQPVCGKALWELHPLSEDVVVCGAFHTVPALPLPNIAVLTLERRDGQVVAFTQDADRVRGLRFERC
ncbi:class A beta-lactamase-related serine hydrolase [Solimonas sp. K1W22B-7]|uniref:serine hydrolase domain-containing protein n=1 Tax=Solimonas sp. K1W22B-7 TaxID=2303331 RepID=UPI000E337B8B|nr:serine hydrolase domain-containing protein [Solimonas sp. K1W22B-7]AXQ30033.1 class A beta-lactamase-related serine hydrolase [Solimonas sp. K1W22B-7]